MSLKSSILAALEQNREAALSGQALAQRLGVSRNAVWKAVNMLKEEGYDIASTPNRGYQLSPLCDFVSEAGIRALLENPTLPIYTLDTVDSTNNEAKRLLASGAPEPFLVVAGEQTAGRGRLGRVFFSPRDAGLYMTVALAPKQSMENALGITAYAAVCVAEAIQRLTGLSARIKWVNDLFVNDKKVCGILTEAVTDFESGTVESLLVGIGVNLRPTAVPKEWTDIIGFLGCDSPLKNRLAAEVANTLLRYSPENTDYFQIYRERSLTLGMRVLCSQGNRSFSGVAIAIDDVGALVVQTDAGETVTLRSGEAKLIAE